MGCHTVTGGASFAGGRGVDTPFGVVVAPNITPDARDRHRQLDSAEFWRAMHHGRSKDGRLLYPAFPYPSFTYVTREDSDACSPTCVGARRGTANQPHDLRFPYSTQAALAVWRALYFRPGEFQAEPRQSADWNRGKYLVQGLGHCAACHSGRNFLGGTSLNTEFAGGLMPDATWYAPSLASPQEAGVQRWTRQDVVKLLKAGVAAGASVSGPMAEVVFSSTQHMSEQDLDAMAQYLGRFRRERSRRPKHKRADADVLARGGKLYSENCASCHGDAGRRRAGVLPRPGRQPGRHADHDEQRRADDPPRAASRRRRRQPQPFGMPP